MSLEQAIESLTKAVERLTGVLDQDLVKQNLTKGMLKKNVEDFEKIAKSVLESTSALNESVLPVPPPFLSNGSEVVAKPITKDEFSKKVTEFYHGGDKNAEKIGAVFKARGYTNIATIPEKEYSAVLQDLAL